jgi:hypothetical protein
VNGSVPFERRKGGGAFAPPPFVGLAPTKQQRQGSRCRGVCVRERGAYELPLTGGWAELPWIRIK